MRSVAEQFAPGRLRYRPSMAVLGWLIPVGNLFLPKQIANDVWHASSPPGQGDSTDPARLLHTWWAACLVPLMTWPLLLHPWTRFRKEVFYWDGKDGWFRYEFQPVTWFVLALHLLIVPAAIVTARYVDRVTAMQAAKARADR
ncbi:DUF4328 domain-containing protein [Streptomyces sp. NBC_00572]|uniref:DUF4328 domain-containing protein n=1 Tax=Streptomyces sp. NBC_00572 TaxID=2903664 RepID=UPI002B1CF4B9|nr:DUF4328 domain-containing protein [Streptomyces sp. NBC_00572]